MTADKRRPTIAARNPPPEKAVYLPSARSLTTADILPDDHRGTAKNRRPAIAG
ncbi:hypothetical protein ACP70R_018931 [Stipagrostis hirtigluma subsp. patula]